MGIEARRPRGRMSQRRLARALELALEWRKFAPKGAERLTVERRLAWDAVTREREARWALEDNDKSNYGG